MEIKDHFEELEGKEVSVAGRMMFKRVMGKASFCNIQDLEGRIQAYVARDEIGVEEYKDFKKMDIGDIIGIKGTVFATKTGEKSIHAKEVVLLSKSPVSYTHLHTFVRILSIGRTFICNKKGRSACMAHPSPSYLFSCYQNQSSI